MKSFFNIFKQKHDAKEFFYDNSFVDYREVKIVEKVKVEYWKNFKRLVHLYRYTVDWKVVIFFTIVMNADNVIGFKIWNILITTFAIFILTVLAFFYRKHINRL